MDTSLQNMSTSDLAENGDARYLKWGILFRGNGGEHIGEYIRLSYLFIATILLRQFPLKTFPNDPITRQILYKFIVIL